MTLEETAHKETLSKLRCQEEERCRNVISKENSMPSSILLLLIFVIFLGAFGYMMVSYHRADAERRAGEKKTPS
jgi:hypothetical protein